VIGGAFSISDLAPLRDRRMARPAFWERNDGPTHDGLCLAKKRRIGRGALTSRLPKPTRLRVGTAQGESMSDTIDTVGIVGDRIRSIIERVEKVEEEIKDLMEAKKEIFLEAKGEGLDVKILKEILKLRKLDQDERDEHETLLDVYMRAMDAPSPAPMAEAA
jgi:uncharacterized protein (UPF0335 family)